MASSEKQHVLIVDDEPLNRELLRRVLKSEYSVTEAADVNEALEVLEENSQDAPVLVLCDHLMPGKTGASLARIVHERWPNIRFMLLTGYDGDEEVVTVFREGLVERVVAKPWRGRDLKVIISACLNATDEDASDPSS